MGATNTSNETNMDSEKIILKLYVVGITTKAQQTYHKLEQICEQHFPGKYEIEIVDLKENPKLAAEEQIFAVPTVVKKLPPPMRKVIGDMSDDEKVLIGLDLSSL
ncbi:MAG: circadian clock KaiB family protein [Bacteroidales bacterium]